MTREAHARAADVARASYGKLLAMLSARSGDIMAAEDALADAFAQALSVWPERGVPDRPEAWLLTVARNRRIDAARRDSRLTFSDEVPEMEAPNAEPALDHRLQLMFVCAHPAIAPEVHTPLMLQTVLGLEADQIARAFVVSPQAMAQRLVRAKRKIKASGIPFVLPDPAAYPARMGAVLEAVYGAYSVDWIGGSGELCHEALFLASLLSDLAPQDPEVLGLSALIAFAEARRPARLVDGILVPVPEQDTALWDRSLIDHAAGQLTRASTMGQIGRFQLEAAIQSVHAARIETGRTDWRALSQIHAGLMKIAPTLGAAIAQAAVVGEDAGPTAGLAMLDRVAPDLVHQSQPAQAVRAELLSRLDRPAEAAEAYARAIALCTDLPARRWLMSRAEALARRAS